MTTAQTIAAIFNNDGQCHDSDAGSIYDLCKARGFAGASDADNQRWDFADGSCLILGSEAWDYGHDDTGCVCFASGDEHWCGR